MLNSRLPALKTSFAVLTIIGLVSNSSSAAALPGTAQGFASNSEGAVSAAHLQTFTQYRKQYFFDESGRLDLTRVSKLEKFLSEEKARLMSSAKLSKKHNMIDKFGYGQDKAEKQGLDAQSKEAEALAPFIFALEHINDLKKNKDQMSRPAIEEKVETILLFFAAAYTVYPDGILTKIRDRGTTLIRNFLDVKKNDSDQVPASNLLDPKTGQFMTLAQVREMQKQKKDISVLNPPSSAFWTNNNVESYDPKNEIYYGLQLFPKREIEIPVFHYKRMGNGNIKIKTYWLDENDRNKKGEPKEKEVTLRLGHEALATPASSHFARIMGFPANPNTFRKKVKLVLGKTSFDQFVKEFIHAHDMEQGSPLTHVERIPNENAVYLKNANLEAYPKEDIYRKMGPFRMGDNGFGNRREYRAMPLYLALIGMADEFEYQTRVDAYRTSKNSMWQPLFFMSDVGQSLGIPTFGNPGTANEFTRKFTWTSDDSVKLFWVSTFNYRSWEKMSYSDLKWMARRLARVSSAQIESIFIESGFPAPVAALYSEKMKSRINGMLKDFGLMREGYKEHVVKSDKELAKQFPAYIDEKGYLRSKVQQIEGNTQPLLGKGYTPYQMVKAAVYEAISGALSNAIKLSLPETLTEGGLVEFDLGKSYGGSGRIYESTRKISVNSEIGSTQHRYLLKDKVSVGIPIGIASEHLVTPASIYYVFSFEFIHSVDTLEEALRQDFFKKMNPFEVTSIREKLKKGEQLYVTHSYGASSGHLKLKAIDQMQVEAALLGWNKQTIKTVYFTKSDDFLEVFVDNYSGGTQFKTGFDVKAIARFAMMYNKNKSQKTQSYYMLDLLNQPEPEKQALNEAFELALVENDFSQMDLRVTPQKLVEKTRSSAFDLGLILWNASQNTQVSEIEFNDKKIIMAQKNSSYDRSFDRIWNDKKSGAGISIANALGNLTNEGEKVEISLEGTLNSDQNRFARLEMNLSFAKRDDYTQKKHLQSKIFDYFNVRSGESKYIDYVAPKQVKQYLELIGTMRWQLSEKAIKDLLTALSDEKNLEHLRNAFDHDKGPQLDAAQILAGKAAKALKRLERGGSKKKLKEFSENLVDIISEFVGATGEHVALIRRFVKDDDIWMVTRIEELLKQTNPSFNLRHDYWAPEVGKFQGHSDLNVFRRTKLQRPILTH